jgi:hypothetical protein
MWIEIGHGDKSRPAGRNSFDAVIANAGRALPTAATSP